MRNIHIMTQESSAQRSSVNVQYLLFSVPPPAFKKVEVSTEIGCRI